MPNDVKAYVSAVVAIVAIVLAFWSGSPVRPEFGPFLLGTGAFGVISEAGASDCVCALTEARRANYRSARSPLHLCELRRAQRRSWIYAQRLGPNKTA
jgi:hypothetical protein